MSTAHVRRRASALLTILVTAVLAAPLAVTAPADAGRPEPLARKSTPIAELRGAWNEFSPDKDGFHDRLVYRLVVHRPSLVYVSVVDLASGESVAGELGSAIDVDDECLTIGKLHCRFAKGSYGLDVARLLPTRFKSPSSGYQPGRFRLVVEALSVSGPDRSVRLVRTVEVVWGVLLGDRPPYTRKKTATMKYGSTLRIPYRLETRSRMNAVFMHAPTGGPDDYAPYATTPIGTLGRGKHVWTWDGTIDGKRVPPGIYLVDLEDEPVNRKLPWYHYAETVVTVE